MSVGNGNRLARWALISLTLIAISAIAGGIAVAYYHANVGAVIAVVTAAVGGIVAIAVKAVDKND